MNIWKAEPLRDYASVCSRFFFRLLWCSVGGILTSLLFFCLSQESHSLKMAAIAIGISAMGAAYDIWRLKT